MKHLDQTSLRRLHGIVDTVDWCTVGVCNLRCPHCYGPAKNLKALPPRQMMQIVDRLIGMSVKRVVFSGGEPLLTPHIFDIMKKLKANNVEIALSTNGSFVERDWEKICKWVDSLNLPLDGHTAKLHAESRADTETFYQVLDAIKRYEITEARPRLLRVGTVFSSVNCDSLVAISKLLEPYSNSISTWKIYEIVNDEIQIGQRQHMLNPAKTLDHAVQELRTEARQRRIVDKVMVASTESRDRAYFMLNPQGQLIVPTHIGAVTHDVVIGDFVNDQLEILQAAWLSYVNATNYGQNHNGHYEK